MRPGPQQSGVERLRHVRGHDREDAVLRWLLRRDAQEAAHDPVEEAAWLVEPGHLGEDRLQRAVHAAHATATEAGDERVEQAAPGPGPLGPAAVEVGHEIVVQQPLGAGREEVGAVAGAAEQRVVGAGLGAVRAGAAGHRPPSAAEGVGLVEEDDDAAVLQRQLAQLLEQAPHLHDADAEEHLDERARLDEDERLARLAGHGLGHERLAGAGRAPQQDAARHVAALVLDLLRAVEEDDVLLDLGQDVVLAPDVGEAGLDVLGHVGLDAAPAEEPEHGDELQDDRARSRR